MSTRPLHADAAKARHDVACAAKLYEYIVRLESRSKKLAAIESEGPIGADATEEAVGGGGGTGDAPDPEPFDADAHEWHTAIRAIQDSDADSDAEPSRVAYSAATKGAYGAVLESMLTSDAVNQDRALRQLAKSVHCDLTGELRLPHDAPTDPEPSSRELQSLDHAEVDYDALLSHVVDIAERFGFKDGEHPAEFLGNKLTAAQQRIAELESQRSKMDARIGALADYAAELGQPERSSRDPLEFIKIRMTYALRRAEELAESADAMESQRSMDADAGCRDSLLDQIRRLTSERDNALSARDQIRQLTSERDNARSEESALRSMHNAVAAQRDEAIAECENLKDYLKRLAQMVSKTAPADSRGQYEEVERALRLRRANPQTVLSAEKLLDVYCRTVTNALDNNSELPTREAQLAGINAVLAKCTPVAPSATTVLSDTQKVAAFNQAVAIAGPDPGHPDAILAGINAVLSHCAPIAPPLTDDEIRDIAAEAIRKRHGLKPWRPSDSRLNDALVACRAVLAARLPKGVVQWSEMAKVIGSQLSIWRGEDDYNPVFLHHRGDLPKNSKGTLQCTFIPETK